MPERPVCLVFVGGDSEEEVSHILGREQGQTEIFFPDSQINGLRLSLPQPDTEKALYARSNHIISWHHPFLRQSFICPQSHFLMLEIISVFLKAILLVNILFFTYSSFPLLPPPTLFPPFSLQALASLNVAISIVYRGQRAWKMWSWVLHYFEILLSKDVRLLHLQLI